MEIDRLIADLTDLHFMKVRKILTLYQELVVTQAVIEGEYPSLLGTIKTTKKGFEITKQNPAVVKALTESKPMDELLKDLIENLPESYGS